ncbi:MAG TPA: DUF3048 C-terminal domain-containing protein, partial [Streptosporangiaceae bacterium]
MAWNRQRITYTTAVTIVLANLVAGALLVSSGGVRVRPAAATPAPTHPATPSPPRSSPPPLRSPFTGATPRLLRYIHRTGRIVDLYAGTTSGYYRNWNRAEPYNLYAYPRGLLSTAAGASTAHDIGFRFGPPPPGGRARRSVSVSYPASEFTFTWSAANGRWLVSMDGTPAVTPRGVRLSAATVVIQHTAVSTSGFTEQGRRPPFTRSTGSGRARVLRNGQAWA